MEYKTTGSILHTQVWCVDAKMEDMGIEDNSWLRVSFNMKSVISVKEIPEDSKEDHFAAGKCCIYLAGSHFIINIDYDTMVNLWTPYQ